MLELRLTSTRYHDSLEEFARLELCRNLGLLKVLPSWLQGSFNNTFTKYFPAACYWLDLPFTARSGLVQLLCCKVDFPLSLPRDKQLAVCEKWLGKMSIVKHQLLRLEACTWYPGIHRALEDLLSPSGLEEVSILYEDLQNPRTRGLSVPGAYRAYRSFGPYSLVLDMNIFIMIRIVRLELCGLVLI